MGLGNRLKTLFKDQTWETENQVPRVTKFLFILSFFFNLGFITLYNQLEIYLFSFSAREITQKEEKSPFSSQKVVSVDLEILHL